LKAFGPTDFTPETVGTAKSANLTSAEKFGITTPAVVFTFLTAIVFVS
jgi:hypothetical protein